MNDYMYFVYYWIIPVAVFYVLFSTPIRSYRRKLKEVDALLAKAPTMHSQFMSVAHASLGKAVFQYWLVLIPLLFVISLFYSEYTKAAEPGADFYGDGLGIFGDGFFLPPIIVCTAIAGMAYARWRQAAAISRFIEANAGQKSAPVALQSAREILGQTSKGKTGVAVLSATAIAASAVIGVAWLGLFYLAAEQAISCARSSKGC